MSKKKLATLILLAASLSAAHATPGQDEIEKLLAQKGLTSQLGNTIQQATDRAANLIKNAMGALGVPYRMGGTSAETGFDCSGFVLAMFQQTAGLALPRTAAEQAAATTKIEKADLQPGDLVFFNTLRRAYSHVGIYMGDGKFIHSPRSGAQVRVESMNISYWQRRFDGARRVLVDEQTSATTTASAPATSRVITRESPAPTTVRLGGTFGKSSATSSNPANLPSDGESI
ncbi:MAG: C40 family peptidase [Pseudomonadota bacterium]|nr:C40 family peptidase [Pseudomonadota bacterium]